MRCGGGNAGQVCRAVVHRNGGVDQLLDVAQQAALFRAAQRNGDAFRVGARSAPDAVHIGGFFQRHVEIDDMGDASHINAASRDVGGHQHGNDARAERFQCARALALPLVAVNSVGRDAHTVQTLHYAIGAVLGLGENQRALHFFLAQQVHQQRGLVGHAHFVETLFDAVCGGGHCGHGHAHRIVQNGIRKMFDGGRHGGREHH